MPTDSIETIADGSDLLIISEKGFGKRSELAETLWRFRSAFVGVAAFSVPGFVDGEWSASAQTATQTVSYEVAAVDQISVSGSPSLVVMRL